MTDADTIRRGLSAFGAAWVYQLGAKPGPDVPEGAQHVHADCTGFYSWCTGRKQVNALSGNPLFERLDGPAPGALVWHPRIKPHRYGHGGLIIAVHPDGDFDTLDCSSTDPASRGGAIRLQHCARDFWSIHGLLLPEYWRPRYVKRA